MDAKFEIIDDGSYQITEILESSTSFQHIEYIDKEKFPNLILMISLDSNVRLTIGNLLNKKKEFVSDQYTFSIPNLQYVKKSGYKFDMKDIFTIKQIDITQHSIM